MLAFARPPVRDARFCLVTMLVSVPCTHTLCQTLECHARTGGLGASLSRASSPHQFIPVTEKTYLFQELYIEARIRNTKIRKGRSFRLQVIAIMKLKRSVL